MSGSLNCVTIIGNLGKDPEVRRLNSGSNVVSFSVAMSETWKDKNSGERKEKTEWVSIVVFNEGLGKVAEQYLKKGSKVYLQGKLQTRKWQDQSGNDKYTTEVVLQNFDGKLILLGDKNGGERSGGGEYDQSRDNDRSVGNKGYGMTRQEAMGGRGAAYDDDSEIPF